MGCEIQLITLHTFEYLVRHRQSAHRRAQIISSSDLSGCLSANTANGDLGLRLQAFIEQCGPGYSAPNNPDARKILFLAVNRVFRVVNPKLKKSLQADCGIRRSAVHACGLGTDQPEAGVTSRVGDVLAWHRWERVGARARRQTSIYNADVLRMSHASILGATMLLEAALGRADV